MVLKCTQIFQDTLGHKTSLNKLKKKKIEIIHGILSNYKKIKLEITNRRKFGMYTNIWILNMLVKNQQKNNYKQNRKEKVLPQRD